MPDPTPDLPPAALARIARLEAELEKVLASREQDAGLIAALTKRIDELKAGALPPAPAPAPSPKTAERDRWGWPL